MGSFAEPIVECLSTWRLACQLGCAVARRAVERGECFQLDAAVRAD